MLQDRDKAHFSVVTREDWVCGSGQQPGSASSQEEGTTWCCLQQGYPCSCFCSPNLSFVCMPCNRQHNPCSDTPEMVSKGTVSFSPQLLPAHPSTEECQASMSISTSASFGSSQPHRVLLSLLIWSLNTVRFTEMSQLTFLNLAFLKCPSCCRAVFGCMQCLDLQGSCQLKSLIFQSTTPVTPWSRMA